MADNAGHAPAQAVTTDTVAAGAPVTEGVKLAGPVAGDTSAPVAVDASEKPAVPTDTVDATVAGDGAQQKPVAADPNKALTPIEQLWAVAEADGHPEIWGHILGHPATNIGTQVILQKMLNANDGNLEKATTQLKEILRYRTENNPLDLVKRVFSKAKFDNLGYITVHGQIDDANPELREVVTWNLYGQVENVDVTFGDTDEFINWRLALMELAVQELHIGAATKPISAEFDPYKTYQVHDYQGINFFRPPANVKAASSQIIKLFGTQYPELLKEKFFVNVPFIMGFVYGIMKAFVAPKTLKKFHPMREGKNLAKEFADSKVAGLGDMLPTAYGGSAEELKTIGRTTNLE